MMNKKKFLAWVLAAAMMATAAPGMPAMTAYAAEAEETEAAGDEAKESKETTLTDITTPKLDTKTFSQGTKVSDMNLPSSLKAKDKNGSVTVKGVSWSSDYTESSGAGSYTFKAALPKGYKLGKDASLPKLTITIQGGETEAQTETPTETPTEAQSEAQSEIQPETEPQTEKQSEAQSEAQSETQTDPQSEIQPKAQPETQSEAQSEAQSEEQSEIQTDVQPAPQDETEEQTDTATPKDDPQPTQDLNLLIKALEITDGKAVIDEANSSIIIYLQKADADLTKVVPVSIETGLETETTPETTITTEPAALLTDGLDLSENKTQEITLKGTDGTTNSQRIYQVSGKICTEHVWGEWTIDKEATCTEKGSRSHICTLCGKSESEEIGLKAHKYSSEWTVDKQPTCTEKGSKSHHCVNCDAKTDVSEIPAYGHTWSKWKVTKEATHTKKGLKERTCSICGETETKKIPKTNIIGKAKKNKITGIDQNKTYGTGNNISFAVIGSGMDNNKPIDGDVRFLPTDWSCNGAKGSWNDSSFKKTLQFASAGTYTLYVNYERQKYVDGEWLQDGDNDTKSATIKIAGKTITTTKAGTTTAKTAAKTGDTSPILWLVGILVISGAAILLMLRKKKK